MKRDFPFKIVQAPDMTIWPIDRGRAKPERHVGRRTSLALLFGAGWLSGCGGLRTIETLTPSGAYLSDLDVAYGPDPRQRLDVYRPAAPSATPSPVVVFFYGGSWRRGEKEAYRFVAEYLTRMGCVAVIADYRLYPAVRFPAFVEDGAAAIAWARDNAQRLGGDQRRIYAMGHSSGAHTAVLLALEPRYLAAVGRSPGDLAGVIGISGPYDEDFSTVRWLRAVFPDTANAEEARPITKARRGAPRMLLANGGRDGLVSPRHAVALATRLRELGSPVDLRIYDAAGHGDILLGLSTTLAGGSSLGADVLSFITS